MLAKMDEKVLWQSWFIQKITFKRKQLFVWKANTSVVIS